MEKEVTVIVPASTSNLGPGFDSLGLALAWRLQCEARRAGGKGLEIEVKYEGKPEWEGPLTDMIAHAVAAWEEAGGAKVPGVELFISGDVPLARGLGSSAAYRMAAAAAVNAISDTPLSEEQVLAVVCRLEHHTDNAVPAMVGGLTVSGWDGDEVRYVSWPVPEALVFVALVPELEIETEKARAVLPESVSRRDAVFNLQHALWIVSAIAAGRPDKLAGAFRDKLHQPFRAKLLPGLDEIIAAAEAAGAYGAFLSGSGSTILAAANLLTANDTADAMLACLDKHGLSGRTRVLEADNEGMKILQGSP